MKQQELTIGLFGFGCVGTGLYEVLNKTKGIKARIKKICIKHPEKDRSLPMEYFTNDRSEILNDPEIDVVVELIDDADAAYEIVVEAMEKGKGVVTANKKMVAEHMEELFELQRINRVPFLYEASSCASIPIIRNIEEYYDNDLLNALFGVFNGSSNYILSKVIDDGMSYPEALKQAQDLGFAETDPTLDVGGFDAKYKLCIMATHAFGVFINPEDVFNYGIQNLNEQDIKYAAEKGYKIKLVANAKRVGDRLCLWVMPEFVSQRDKLYYINNEYNGVTVEAIFSDQQFFLGKGAGSLPTGSAVLSDISALTYNYKYEYKKFFQDTIKPEFSNDFFLEIYVRYQSESDLLLVPFARIDEKYEGRNSGFAIGKIKLSDLLQSGACENPNLFIAQTVNDEITLELKEDSAFASLDHQVLY